ncbi:tRNA (5-methylaminomethyl-2-thiouridine)(34)-methyltransferase MnmD [Mucilaginibacter sp. L196]|uniref:tRNA (5-methylaminomethyl-2-thiouridine)(34)-methyltransferase MnmD n=1 Tax=Mucilaginibacter sp. L196 TaxID=1641870 RepID=UPI00131E440B|nr:tRNA (5-methylaminomethyl-2-thiouridine)(34)-methyltransferase MnmD [Mucilaginibacter sp. L196]
MLEIVKTSDGSNTIFNSEVGENYHSHHGALQESKHVFVKSGLQYFLENKNEVSPTGGDLEGASVSILEIGFGTGLNFLLSADYCSVENIQLDYTGIEAYSLTDEMISQTGYDEYVTTDLWQEFIKHYPSALQNPIKLNKSCQLQIANVKLMDFQSDQKFDVIYFDAFAASYQPEMWNEAAITHTLQFLKPGGVFVTYAITGNLKRIVKSLGLKVEKAPGAPGKREMLRAY